MVPRYMFTQGHNVLGQIVMKHAHIIGDVLNFDLCDLQKVGKIKNLGIMSCILSRCPYDKNLEMIQPLVQDFLCFRFWPLGSQIKNQTGPKFGP
jgi:hypothetical protein